MKKLKRCIFFLIIFLFAVSLVSAANLGTPCSEKYFGCDENYCHCANVCGMDYECGADDGVNPEFFFDGKTCPPSQPDPDDIESRIVELKNKPAKDAFNKSLLFNGKIISKFELTQFLSNV